MRRQIAIGASLAGCMLAGPVFCQPVKWSLECKYDNGSIAFLVDLAGRRTQGNMVAHQGQVNVSDSKISFHVSAKDTTLLQDFDVDVDRASMRWTSGKPGWGGTCRKL